MQQRLTAYFDILGRLPLAAKVTDRAGRLVALDDFFTGVIARMRDTHAAGNKLMFIGNGGSSGIATHMANDFTKNGNMRALSLTDGAVLTCLGNDYGFEHIFAKQIDMHARAGDLLVAISSSGNSANILNGVAAARTMGCGVVTLSGFRPDNRLRALGDLNVYVENDEYGFVEVAHQALIHAVLDIACGWGAGLAEIAGTDDRARRIA